VFLVEEGSDVTGEDLVHHGTPFHPQVLVLPAVPKKVDLVFDDWIRCGKVHKWFQYILVFRGTEFTDTMIYAPDFAPISACFNV
jgi:hypothetical protein